MMLLHVCFDPSSLLHSISHTSPMHSRSGTRGGAAAAASDMPSRPLLTDAHETHKRFTSTAGQTLTATKAVNRDIAVRSLSPCVCVCGCFLFRLLVFFLSLTLAVNENRLSGAVHVAASMSVRPDEGFLQPFGRAEIAVQCRANMPGRYRTSLLWYVALSVCLSSLLSVFVCFDPRFGLVLRCNELGGRLPPLHVPISVGFSGQVVSIVPRGWVLTLSGRRRCCSSRLCKPAAMP